MLRKKRKPPIKEYIFVDVQRLESYIAQIRGDVKYDRIPTWNVGLSATNPTLGASIQKVARKPNYHEMATVLLDHLRKSQQLDTERESVMLRHDALFCYETMAARKVVFPATLIKDIPGIKELALWISLAPETMTKKQRFPAGPLYLIESYFESDAPYVRAMSGFSAFHYILEELGDALRKTVLLDPVHEEVEENVALKFASAPFEYLAGIKARVSDSRRIECLYRRRATMVDLQIGKLVTFGYPIFVAEAVQTLPA